MPPPPEKDAFTHKALPARTLFSFCMEKFCKTGSLLDPPLDPPLLDI